MELERVIFEMVSGRQMTFRGESAKRVLNFFDKDGNITSNPLVINDDNGVTTDIVYVQNIECVRFLYE